MEKERIILEHLERGELLTPEALSTIVKGGSVGATTTAAGGQKGKEGGERLLLASVRVTKNYTKKSKKRTYEDFVRYYNHRFAALSGMLRQRAELAGATAIARIPQRPNERAAAIGMVKEKSITRNGSVMLQLEDPSGELRVVVTKKESDLYNAARDLVLDEVIGVSGSTGNQILFANELFFPDVPVTHELKKSPREEYLAIIGDPQVGSREFLSKDFARLTAWFHGRLGNEEQRRIASLVKYVIVIGDLVEGVGVYPGQEAELAIKDITAQYEAFASLIKKLPGSLPIICIPGNHDAGRLAEPQPPIYKDFAASLYELPNVLVLSNPSTITIGTTTTFPGIEVLLYHGYSLPYYADTVPGIRERGGQKRAELIMKFLLQRRHLAPTHGSNLFIPDAEEDPLIIERVPDIFITGHIHRVATANYRGVTLINGSAWCDITENQEKRGLEPQPGRLILVNLKTRDVRIINFYTGQLGGEGSDATSEEGAPGKTEMTGEGVVS